MKAGASATTRDIAVLKMPLIHFCPENEPLSIRCEGHNVRPEVRFYVNGDRKQTEGNKPYHTAGDIDDTGFINEWTDYEEITADMDGTRTLTIKCMYRNRFGRWRNFNCKMIIEETGCGTCPKTGLTISKVLVDTSVSGEVNSERVVIYNSGAHPIDLSTIKLFDLANNEKTLTTDTIQPGECKNVLLSGKAILNNSGGDTIRLVNTCGDTINTKSYTEEQDNEAGVDSFISFDSNCV